MTGLWLLIWLIADLIGDRGDNVASRVDSIVLVDMTRTL